MADNMRFQRVQKHADTKEPEVGR